MNLSEILKKQGFFSNDIKNRLKNKQFLINGNKIGNDINLQIEVDENNNPIVFEAGEFVSNLIVNNKVRSIQMKLFGLDNLFDSNIDNNLTRILEDFILIKVSKKQSLILKRRLD